MLNIIDRAEISKLGESRHRVGEHIGEKLVVDTGINGCHSRNAKLFEWIELSVVVKCIYVNKTKVIHMH